MKTGRLIFSAAAILLTLTVFLLMSAGQCRSAQCRQALIVVIDSGSTRYTETADSTFGLQYEIARIFADSMKMNLKVVKQNNLHTSIALLRSRQCDIVAIPIPTTTEYIDNVAFSVPIFFTRQVLVQCREQANQPLKVQYELANDTIYLPANSPQIQRIKNLSDEIADTIFITEIPAASIEQVVADVAAGKYKFTVCNERLARKLKRNYANIDVSMPVGFEQSHSWAVNIKNQELLDSLNNFLETFKKTRQFREILQKYE